MNPNTQPAHRVGDLVGASFSAAIHDLRTLADQIEAAWHHYHGTSASHAVMVDILNDFQASPVRHRLMERFEDVDACKVAVSPRRWSRTRRAAA